MINLSSRGKVENLEGQLVGKLRPSKGIKYGFELVNSLYDPTNEDRVVALVSQERLNSQLPNIFNLSNYKILAEGDVVYINDQGVLDILYRRQSKHNTLFITDQCNSYCLMCSQPPKNKDDFDFHYFRNKCLIPLMDEETEVIGITGGEPFLLGDRMIEILEDLKSQLPQTTIHLLTNGKVFAWNDWAEKMEQFKENLILAVPLYSDNFVDHDYIVQSNGAFRQTMLGLHNLAKYQIHIELRVVLQRPTIKRIEELSLFITKNLPFVESVAFMGLEFTGLAIANKDKLWIEPSEYASALKKSVFLLDRFGIRVNIFNMPLCVLEPELRDFATKSISDWKRSYLDKCEHCSAKSDCGGVFGTSRQLTNEISPL